MITVMCGLQSRKLHEIEKVPGDDGFWLICPPPPLTPHCKVCDLEKNSRDFTKKFVSLQKFPVIFECRETPTNALRSSKLMLHKHFDEDVFLPCSADDAQPERAMPIWLERGFRREEEVAGVGVGPTDLGAVLSVVGADLSTRVTTARARNISACGGH